MTSQPLFDHDHLPAKTPTDGAGWWLMCPFQPIEPCSPQNVYEEFHS